MKKKIMALILVIPIIFVFSVFTITEQAVIGVEISPTKIGIVNKPSSGNIYLPIDGTSYYEPIAQVYPTQASNSDYTVIIQSIEGDDNAFVLTNGRITAVDLGKTRLTVKTSNGHVDTVDIISTTDKILSIQLQLLDSLGQTVDTSNPVTSGAYSIVTTFYPSSLDGDIEYNVSDDTIALIDNVGNLQLLRSGRVDITAKLDNGAVGEITQQLSLTVDRLQTDSGIVINGVDNCNLYIDNVANNAIVEAVMEVAADKNGDIGLTYNSQSLPIDCYTVTYLTGQSRSSRGTKANNNSSYAYKIQLDINKIRQYFLINDTQDIDLAVSVDGIDSGYSFRVKSVDFGLSLYWSSGKINSSITISIDTPISITAVGENGLSLADYDITVVVGNASLSAATNGNKITLSSRARITSDLVVRARNRDTQQIAATVSIEVFCVSKINTVEFTNQFKGGNTVAGIKTIADRIIKGNDYVPLVHLIALEINASTTVTDKRVYLDMNYWSSDESIASVIMVEGYPCLDIRGSGLVGLRVYSKYSTVTSQTLQVYCLKDSVEVSTGEQFFKVADEGKKIVLSADISLGDGMTAEQRIARIVANKFESTYNTQFLINSKRDTKLSYIVDIKNDLHGNGHEVDTHSFATMKNTLGKYWVGPIDYASVGYNGGGIYVYGQDNVSYLMRTDGVQVNNVSLKAIKDEYLYNDQKLIDLTRLDYAGTVVDINASVSIINSRISNGRNTVRIYGGNKDGGNFFNNSVVSLDAVDKIDVVISSCELYNAREFVLKIGSNKAVLATVKDGKKNIPRFDMNQPDANTKYIATNVLLRDSILHDSGLLCIGMESNFSGDAFLESDIVNQIERLFGQLVGNADFKLNWHNVAGTSYPSILTISGDSHIFGWKMVDSINSESIMKIINTGVADADEYLKELKLDIGTMLKAVAKKLDKDNKGRDYSDLVTQFDGQQYVFGGIVLYGGGYNYSVVNAQHCMSELSYLGKYDINLKDINVYGDTEEIRKVGRMLSLAAGEQDFVFRMFGSESPFDITAETELKANYKLTPTPL